MTPCALAKCAAPECFRCGQCRQTQYCCKEHQLADWRAGHRQACIPQAAAAASGPQRAVWALTKEVTLLKVFTMGQPLDKVCDAVVAIRLAMHANTLLTAAARLEVVTGLVVVMKNWACGGSDGSDCGAAFRAAAPANLAVIPQLNILGWSAVIQTIDSAPPTQRTKLREAADSTGALRLVVAQLSAKGTCRAVLAPVFEATNLVY